ncbi:hypothetical protein GEV43_10240 [Actinomadura sp. J1-007]|uniref:hypothetical protein n=1 Tax=Actinomadura sp. J1-007 TaxID=2661913 RepID=UPI00132779C3|nr:hypothetical protein [Actinomadura sp. J1-007]MWK34381.1 hypothetical protein [Actinomadura sp. J1-007]
MLSVPLAPFVPTDGTRGESSVAGGRAAWWDGAKPLPGGVTSVLCQSGALTGATAETCSRGSPGAGA